MNNTNIQINHLRQDETIQLVIRRHWMSLVYTGLYIFAMFWVASIGYMSYIYSWLQRVLPGTFFWILLIAYFMIFSLFIYVYWVDNELDFYIITSERVIGVEQLSFLNRTVRECSIEKVQEVNGFTRWLLENLLNFGTVTIRTASETSEFKMELAPMPFDNMRFINNVIQEHRAKNKIRLEEQIEQSKTARNSDI
jgi:uncharacterized membrane protein YdbT with pleckstrin-like domain